MSFSQIVYKFSFKQLIREKWQLLMWILIPLMIGGLFSLMSGSGGQPKPVGTLLITDHDDTFLSQFITRGFQQGPMAEMFILKNVDSQLASKMMSEGKASAWIEIEEGYSDKFLNNQPTQLKLIKNPSQNILPQIAETAVGVMADGGHYVQQLFAEELSSFNKLLTGENISDAQVALMSVKIKSTMESLEKQLFPPQIKAIKKIDPVKSKSSVSFIQYMFPGIMFMSLLFAAQGLALEFWKDKTQGILRRLLASPSGMPQYLNGKLIYSAVIFIIISFVIGILGLLLLEVGLDKIFVIVGWLMISGLVLWSMMLFISLLLPTRKTASIVTNALVFPLMMLGGSFFPFEAMPKWMVAIGQWLPNGYLLQSFKAWFIDNKELQVLIIPAAVAIGFIIIMWFVNKSILNQFARD